MYMGRGHWLAALFVALALHAGVVAALFWPKVHSGTQDIGIGGIEIALGSAGRAPGDPKETETSEAEALLPPQPEPLPEPETPELDTVEAIVEEPEPVETKQAVQPERPPKIQPRPASTELAATQTEAEVVETEESVAGAGGRTGSQDHENLENQTDVNTHGMDSSAGGRPGAKADYAAMLVAWLERHKEYPRRAQLRRHEGIVMLYFVIDRTGRVSEYRVQVSSGSRLLDQAAITMLQRAQPLPPMPDHFSRDRLELVVPVQFFMS